MVAMTVWDLLLLLLIAGVCGGLAQLLSGYTHGGCFVSVAVGLVGALIGITLARTVGVPDLLAVEVGGTSFPVVWSIIGGALFVSLLALLRGRETRKHDD